MRTSVISKIQGSKIRLQNGTKNSNFITHATRPLLWIRFVAVAFRSDEVFWRRGPPCDLFCLTLDPPLGRYGQNIFMHVPDHEHFIPTKFRKHPLTGSVVKAGNVFPYICTCISAPLPFHLNKFIENSLKCLKHLNLLYKHSSNYWHGNYTK